MALVGALAVVAAFFMPWFDVQRLLMSGQFLNEFLAGTRDLRQFLPTFAGGPGEVTLLRALVLLFPACGVVAAALVLLGACLRRDRWIVDTLLALVAVVILAALGAGVTQLPVGATPQIGLGLMGAGGVAILAGLALEIALDRTIRAPHPVPEGA